MLVVFAFGTLRQVTKDKPEKYKRNEQPVRYLVIIGWIISLKTLKTFSSNDSFL